MKVRAVIRVAVVLAAAAFPVSALADVTIAITDGGLRPTVVTVKPGEPITWSNAGTKTYTVRFSGGPAPDTRTVAPGGSFTTYVPDIGTFRYTTTAPGELMQGRVIGSAKGSTAVAAPASSYTPPTHVSSSSSGGGGSETASEAAPAVAVIATPSTGGSGGVDWPRIAMFVAVGLVLATAAIVVAMMAGVAVAFSRRGQQHTGPRY